MAAATPLGTYTKDSDGSADHQFMNPCKVVVKADPGIFSDLTFWLQPQAYTFAGTALPAFGWHAVRVEYKNASNQTITIPLGNATSPVSFSVPLNLTGVSNYAPRLLFTVLFATNRFRYGTQNPEYEEYIQISATVLNTSSFTALDADWNGLADAWETQYFGKVGNDPSADPDLDGITNFQEQTVGTNPNDPDQNHNGVLDGQDDFDGDGIGNARELIDGTNPFDPNSALNPPQTQADASGLNQLAVYTPLL